MMHYGINARAYLERAKKQFRKNTNEALLYAVLELRCAIEARLQEILDPHSHVSKNEKKEYQIKKLSRVIAKKLCDPDTGTEVTVVIGRKKIVLRYIPVSSSLREFAQRAGDYLHPSQRLLDTKTWKALRSEVSTVIKNLEENLTGTLLGPILISKDGMGHMNIELIDNARAMSIMKNAAKGKQQFSIDVSYFEVR